MHIGEKKLMEFMASLACINGGDILEVGFGLNLSANEVQNKKTVTSHTIIEVHPEIYERAIFWKKNKKNTEILFGGWYEILPLKNKVFDGIIHDTHNDRNIPKFLDIVKPNCKEGTIVVFFENQSNDPRLREIKFDMNPDDVQVLPYKDSFRNNNYTLKYSVFNGIQFVPIPIF
jgi:spermidine synthase